MFSKSIWFPWCSWMLRKEWAKIAILLRLLTDACLRKLVEIQKQTSLHRNFSRWCAFPKTYCNWNANQLKLQHLKMFVYFYPFFQLWIYCVQNCFALCFSFFEEANFGAIKMCNRRILVDWMFRVKTEFLCIFQVSWVYSGCFVCCRRNVHRNFISLCCARLV